MADESSMDEEGPRADASATPLMVRSSSSSSGSDCVCAFLGMRLVGTPGLANREKRGLPAPVDVLDDAAPLRETGGLFSSLTSRPAKSRILDMAWAEWSALRTAAEPQEGRDLMGFLTPELGFEVELAEAVIRKGPWRGESEMLRSRNEPWTSAGDKFSSSNQEESPASGWLGLGVVGRVGMMDGRCKLMMRTVMVMVTQ